jgi:ketosteroid isomerase-like protein
VEQLMAKTRLVAMWIASVCSASAVCAQAQPDAAQMSRWQEQVHAAECSFAASMAARDLPAFERHLAEPAIFFNGREVQQGRAAVVAAWKPFYEGTQAPFSWEPDQIVVVADGSLAYSSGRLAAGVAGPLAHRDRPRRRLDCGRPQGRSWG